MRQTIGDLNDLQPFMGYLFILFLVSQVILIPPLLKGVKKDKKN